VKPTLWLLPLEPLEERYTGQWYKWLPETFSKAFEVVTLYSRALTKKVEVGAFLDLNSTAHYKAEQLRQVAELFADGRVKSGDAFWVSDIEFWGIESIRYLARLQGIRVYLFGFLHAASYTNEDFMAPMADIGQYLEPAWIAAFDKVFVGSHYHRRKVIEQRLTPLGFEAAQLAERLVVTGNPFRSKELVQLAQESPFWKEGAGGVLDMGGQWPRRDINGIHVLFPHRPDHEKRPRRFLRLIEPLMAQAAAAGKKLNVAFTTGREKYRSTNDPRAVAQIGTLAAHGKVKLYENLKRGDFYALLARTQVVVSTAIEENFGYAMVEGMAMGAQPLMPHDYSYPELVKDERGFLYDGDEEFADSLNSLLLNGNLNVGRVRSYAAEFDGAEDRILNAMLTAMD